MVPYVLFNSSKRPLSTQPLFLFLSDETIIEPWIYPSVAFWVLERLLRIVKSTFLPSSSSLKLHPLPYPSRTEVVSGAILVSVSMPSTSTWKGGQHYHLMLWGKNLLSSKPWMIGQGHPFSVANLPLTTTGSTEEEGQVNEMKFIIRIKHGITADLEKFTIAQGEGAGKEASLSVALEGPYGAAGSAAQYHSVLFVAGGTGISHAFSSLLSLLREEGPKKVTKDIHLVWCICYQG